MIIVRSRFVTVVSVILCVVAVQLFMASDPGPAQGAESRIFSGWCSTNDTIQSGTVTCKRVGEGEFLIQFPVSLATGAVVVSLVPQSTSPNVTYSSSVLVPDGNSSRVFVYTSEISSNGVKRINTPIRFIAIPSE